jgi:putative peptidoglycan lipid II flippase
MGSAVRLDARSTQRLPRIIAAAAIMGAVLYGLAWAIEPWLYQTGWRYIALAGLIAAGVLAYSAAGPRWARLNCLIFAR